MRSSSAVRLPSRLRPVMASGGHCAPLRAPGILARRAFDGGHRRRTRFGRPASAGTADSCNRPTSFIGSRATMPRSAARSASGSTSMPPQAANGHRRPSRSRRPEPINAAACCLATLAAASAPARWIASKPCTAVRGSISRTAVCRRASRRRRATAWRRLSFCPADFIGEPEVDHFDFLQVGWTRLAARRVRLGRSRSALRVFNRASGHVYSRRPGRAASNSWEARCRDLRLWQTWPFARATRSPQHGSPPCCERSRDAPPDRGRWRLENDPSRSTASTLLRAGI